MPDSGIILVVDAYLFVLDAADKRKEFGVCMQAGESAALLVNGVGAEVARNERRSMETHPHFFPSLLISSSGSSDGKDWSLSKQHLTAPSNWRSYFSSRSLA